MKTIKNQFIQRVYNSKLQRVEKQWIDLRKRKTYHTPESYESAGIAPFVEHTTRYLAGERTVPVGKAPSIAGECLYFTFSDFLYQLFIEDLQKMKKPYEAALKYGFQGYSKGGKNGVFLLRKQDGGLLSDIERLVNKQGLVTYFLTICYLEGLFLSSWNMAWILPD
jgi:hypothetical protein